MLRRVFCDPRLRMNEPSLGTRFLTQIGTRLKRRNLYYRGKSLLLRKIRHNKNTHSYALKNSYPKHDVTHMLTTQAQDTHSQRFTHIDTQPHKKSHT